MRKLAFLFLLSLTACQTPATYGPRASDDELAAEKAYQQQLVDDVKAQGGQPRPWRNRAGMQKQFERVADRIEKAGAEVCRDMGLPAQKRSCYYYFQTSRDQNINASADGTTVTVNGGMMRFINSDDELAGVMGHELAHNLMAHSKSKTTNAFIGEMMGAALDAVAASEGIHTGGGFADTGAYVGAVGYSPEFEQEADYVGLYIAARAGYKLQPIAQYWRRLSMEEPGTVSGGDTHPSNPARFIAIQKTIEEIDYKRKHRMAMIPELKQEVTSN